MKIGIERTLVNALIEVHTPLVTTEQAEKFFKDLVTSELTVEPTAVDFDNMAFTGDITCKSRRFKASKQRWGGSNVSEIILDSLKYTKTLEDFLNEADNALVYIDPDTDAIYVPHTSETPLTETEVLDLMSFATGFDFTDLKTFKPEVHFTSFMSKEQITTPPANLAGRIEGIWTLSGVVLKAPAVYFINDGFFEFSPDVDLGVVPGPIDTASVYLTEDGNTFVTEDGSRLILE